MTTLVDAGPLVAIIDADEADHDRCAAALASVALPLVSTWPAFAEAMHLVRRAGGHRAQAALWALVRTGRLELAALSDEATRRSEKLMAKYADLPMDLADATLVALAEERNQRRIFTIDDDFLVYRLPGNRRFEIVPGQSRFGR